MPDAIASSSKDISHDPILEKLANTNTFDSDWETLRHHLHLALISTLPLFLSLSPTSPRSKPQINTSPKSQPTSSLEPPSDSLLMESSTTDSSRDGEGEEVPSTSGGLIIPPFPPRDPNRVRRNSNDLTGNIKINGGHPLVGAVRSNVYEDAWDEDVVIGGKKLIGYMKEEEGKKEIDRLGRILDHLESPPFTLQRLAELLLTPTKQHKQLGKFLRSIEKNLLVTTSWEPPSYIPQPMPGFSEANGVYSSSSSPAILPRDPNSTMPIGSATPIFSPIPFLQHHDDDISEMDIDEISNGPTPSTTTGITNNELLEPIDISSESSSPGRKGQNGTNNGGGGGLKLVVDTRSPTPEPEEIKDKRPDTPIVASRTQARQLTIPSGNGLTGIETDDPANQPFLGKVDELDTGPLLNGDRVDSNGDYSRKGDVGRVEGGTNGAGEGGIMPQHGMSQTPIPFSTTTEIPERKLASIPRSKSTASLNDRFVAAEIQDKEDHQQTAEQVVQQVTK